MQSKYSDPNLWIGFNPKACPKCKITKQATGFYLQRNRFGDRGLHLSYACIQCTRAGYRARRKVNGVEMKLSSMRYRIPGITSSIYNQMLIDQCGRCAICGNNFTDRKSGMHIDHCHKTGAIRSILCGGCNIGIGMFGESKETLRLAIEYIERFE